MFHHNFVTPPKLIPATHPLTGGRGYEDETGAFYQATTSWIDENWDKTHIKKWKERFGEAEADRIKNRAADRGSALHTTLEAYIRNEEIDIKRLDYLNRSLFVKVKPLVDRIDNIRLIETPIYSKRLGLAGRPDCISDFDGSLAIVDFKTSIKIKRKKWIVNYFLQTACYANMFYELYGEMPRKSVLIIAVEQSNQPQLQVESMDLCVRMLDKFRADPVGFQKKLAA
jgi:hypothetical protein